MTLFIKKISGVLMGSQQQTAQQLVASIGPGRQGAPLRRSFVVTDDGGATPLASLLRQRDGKGGGPSGALRVKLYLSLLWVCARAPHTSARPARVWASLLGLDEPETNGARRVQSAWKELEARGFVRVRRSGTNTPAVIELLSELGDGSRYRIPGKSFAGAGERGAPGPAADVYFRVPEELWLEGAIVDLEGPGLAMLLVLLAESRGEFADRWFSNNHANTHYGLSESTRVKGLRELRKLNLVDVRKQAVNSTVRSGVSRNVYRVRMLEDLNDPLARAKRALTRLDPAALEAMAALLTEQAQRGRH